MSDVTDRMVALKAVIDRVQPDTVPVLTQGEIELELDRCKLASTWAVDTVYNIGQLIVPPTRNGHFYEVVQPGTSGSTIPLYTFFSPATGARFTDGNSNPRLTWVEAGDDHFNGGIFGAESNVYDIRGAARLCWMLKARKAAQFIDEGDASFEQIYKHCMEQANMIVPWSRTTRMVRV